MVRAAVPERELERPQAEREPDELVAEADAEERRTAEQIANGLHRSVELGRVAGAVADQHRGGSSSSTASASQVPGTTTAWTPDSTSRRTIECLQPRSSTTTRGPAPTVYGSATQASSAGGGEASSGSASIRGQSMCGCASARACSSSGDATTERAAHGAVVAQTPHERSRVDLLERDDASLREPGRPRRPRAPHHDALGPHPARLEQPLVDAVVADEGRGEGEHLARVARVGDRLLVAGGSGREARLARRHAGGADGAAGEDGAVLEHEMASQFLTTVCIVRIVYA